MKQEKSVSPEGAELEKINQDAKEDTGKKKRKLSRKAKENLQKTRILNYIAEYPKANNNQISKLADCSIDTVAKVRKQFAKVFESLPIVDEFRSIRKDVLTASQVELLKNMIDPDKLKKASTRDLALSFGIIYDKERLEAGQSTNNQAVQVQFSNKK